MSSVQMPSPRLPFETRDGLARVGRRRMVLLVVRAGAAMLAVVAVTCLVAAIADRMLLLSDTARWSLSAGFFLVLLLAVIAAALPCLRRWGMTSSARLVESTVPALRNRLLSAVELAGEGENPSLGSPAFRDKLQQEVAREIHGLQVTTILPWQLIRPVLLLAAVTVLACVGLFAVPGLSLPQHLLRVLFPAANIARPSAATLRFLSPATPAAPVPLAERLAVELEVAVPATAAFGFPDTVQLEVEILGELSDRQRIDLVRQPVESPHQDRDAARVSTYQGLWLVDGRRQRYRAVSPIGETPWAVLEATPRPHVEQVEIEITPPPYADEDPIATSSDRADVAAVVGSQVRWTILPSAPLNSAELVWLDSAADSAEPMRQTFTERPDGRWFVEAPVSTTRRLQFELVSSVGMTSLFPPTARLTAVEDEPPQLVWRQPESHEGTVGATSSHRMEAELTDEFPLTSLEQWVRVNRGEWTTIPRSFETAVAQQEIGWHWDLLPLALVPGDLVETKLVAVDRRGLQGGSPTLEWVVSESLLQLAAVPQKPARREIARQLRALAFEADDMLAEATLERILPKDDQQLTVDQATTGAAELRATADRLTQQAAQIREAIHAAIRETDERLAADELKLTAAALSGVEIEHADALRQAADALEHSAELPEGEGVKERTTLWEQPQQVRQTIEQIDRRFRSLVGQDVLDEAALRLDAAARFQRELVSRPDMIGSETAAREQQLLAVHMRAAAQTLERDASLLPDGAARQAVRRKEWAEEMANRLEQAGRRPVSADDEEAFARATADAHDILAELESNRSVHGISPGLSGEARQARRSLRQLAGTAAEIVGRAAEPLKQSTDLSSTEIGQAAAMLEQLMHRRAAMLAEAATQQVHTAADLGAAYRGLSQALGEAMLQPRDVQQSFEATARAVKTLEAAGRLESVVAWVDHLLATERDLRDRVAASTSTPRIWEATSQELDDAATAIRQAGLPADVADQVQAARWSPAAEEIGRKVSPRQWDLSQTVSAVTDLEALRGDLQHQLDALQGPVAEARAALQASAPSIPDLAREAAERAAGRQRAAEQLAAAEAAGETTDIQAVLPDEAVDGRELGDRLEAALVDAAAARDLLDAGQREQARDADLARELVLASQHRVEEATTEARRDQGQDRAASLGTLAEALREAEDTFSMIADHFERNPQASPAAASQPPAESLEAAAARQAPAAAATLDEAYDQAERLGEIAQTPPDELLRRLEEELQTNLPMREALSEIAGGLAEQSQRALAFAAERERNLRHDIESSDARVREEKRQFLAEFRLIGEQTARVAQRLGQEAQRQAGAAGLPERQERLADVAKQLEQAAEAVRALPDTASVPDLVDAAGLLDQAIDTTAPELQEAKEALASAAAMPRSQTDDQERRALSEATVASGRWHQQDVRWADQDLRTRERRIQDADRLVQEADRQLQRAQAQEEKSREQVSREPDSGARQEQLQRAEVQRREAEAFVELSREIRQREERRLEDARSVRELAGRQPAVLDAANPQAQFAERLTTEAIAQADQVSRQLGGMVSDVGWRQQLAGSQGQLDVSARQQETVAASVAEAARSLERAAAHEMRLGAYATAGQLADAAQRVEATARQEPVTAGEMLRQAAESEEARSFQARASNQASQQAVESLSRAGEAIAQRADELARLLSPTADSEEGTDSRESASQGNAAEGASSSGSQSSPLQPDEMARMLDQLDREMRQSQAGASTSPGQSGEPSAARRGLQRSQNQLARGLQAQRGTPGTPTSQQQSPSMTDAQATPSMASQSGNGMLQEAAAGDAAGAVRLLEADGREVFIGGWNRLRQRQAGEVVESLRDTIAPRYRRQVEQYFRVLSERGQAEGERR